MKENKLAKELLNAVYAQDVEGVRNVITQGANPSWIFNGYPIIIHAVNLQNKAIVMLLIKCGAQQVEQALGFALEHGIGELVWPLSILGIVPKATKESERFGAYPNRFAPTSIAIHH